MLVGRLLVNGLEGAHYELEAVVEGRKAVYVVIPAGEEVERALAASIGKRVRVAGVTHEGPSIFMRGPVLRVTHVQIV